MHHIARLSNAPPEPCQVTAARDGVRPSVKKCTLVYQDLLSFAGPLEGVSQTAPGTPLVGRLSRRRSRRRRSRSRRPQRRRSRRPRCNCRRCRRLGRELLSCFRICDRGVALPIYQAASSAPKASQAVTLVSRTTACAAAVAGGTAEAEVRTCSKSPGEMPQAPSMLAAEPVTCIR